MADQYPNVASIFKAGQSYENREILGIKIEFDKVDMKML